MQTVMSDGPMDAIASDFFGPLPETPNAKFKYVLSFVDHFSRFVLLFPIANATSVTLVKMLQYIFCTYGAPVRFISDNGPQYLSHRVKECLKEWGVQQVFTAPWHPQSNWSERVFRNLKAMLACFHSSEHTRWADHLVEFQFAINSAHHDAVGMTPAELFLGRKLIGPGDQSVMFFPHPRDRESDLEEARSHMLTRQAENKLYYDKTRSAPMRYNPGDKVLLKAHPLSNAKRNFAAKLAERWKPDFVVLERLGPLTYGLEHVYSKKRRIAHVEQLKPFLT